MLSICIIHFLKCCFVYQPCTVYFLEQSDCWALETFFVHCTIYEATFMAGMRQAKLRTRLRWADQTTDAIWHLVKAANSSVERPTLVIPSAFETMQIALVVPDVRPMVRLDNALVHAATRLVRKRLHISSVGEMIMVWHFSKNNWSCPRSSFDQTW